MSSGTFELPAPQDSTDSKILRWLRVEGLGYRAEVFSTHSRLKDVFIKGSTKAWILHDGYADKFS